MPDSKSEPDYLLVLAAARIHRAQSHSLEGMKPALTVRQFRVLFRVSQGHTSPTALAQLARRSLPTVSETIEGLVRKGLLKRRSSSGDKRAVVITLTAAGTRALAAADERISQLIEELLAGLSKTEAKTLLKSLNTVYEAAENSVVSKTSKKTESS